MFHLRKIFNLRKIFAVPKDFLKSKIYCIRWISKNDGNRWCRIRRDTPPPPPEGAAQWAQKALYVVCASAAVVAVGGSRWRGGGDVGAALRPCAVAGDKQRRRYDPSAV